MTLNKFCFFLLIFFCGNLCAQNINIKIINEASAEPIAFAEVHFFNSEKSQQANINGEVAITAEAFPLELEIRALGFRSKKVEIPAPTDSFVVMLRPEIESLSQVVIQSAIIPTQIQNTPAAVNIFKTEEIERTSTFTIAEVLTRSPGVVVQQGALNTSKIVIRGVGSRAQYGTNRVKAYFDGIPLTTADGATTVEDLDPDAIGRVEIIKGPTSSVYGAGLGGVMNFYSEAAAQEETSSQVKYLFGSFGLSKKTVSGSHSGNNNRFFASYNHLKSEGFRSNSEYDRKNLLLNGKLYSENGNNLSVLTSYTKLKAFIPSSINEETFNESPQDAAYTWGTARGYEAYDKVILGAAYRHQFSDKFSNNTSVFLISKIADEPRPFDILKEEQMGTGARTKFNYSSNLFEIPTQMSVGAEYLREWYNISTFENLYEDFPDEGSVLGEILSNNKQERQYLNVFGQMNLSFSKNFNVEAGLNLNTTNYDLTDLFVQDEVDQTGDYTFKTILSPRIGATYNFSEAKTIYASISHGFSTPNVEETLTPEGMINTNLQSETGMNYEIGLKANWFNNKLYTEIAAYSIQVNDLLVAQRVAEDQYVGVNAGKTDHTGIELMLDYSWDITNEIELRPYASASFNFYKFDKFVDDEDDFSGNELTGVPDKTIYLGVDLKTDFGLSFFSTYNHVGQIPLDDANSLYTDSYSFLNLKIKQRIPLFEDLEAGLIAGVNNVFDEHYAASILTNAVGFGGAAPRYYYPGDPRNYYAGVSFNYLF